MTKKNDLNLPTLSASSLDSVCLPDLLDVITLILSSFPFIVSLTVLTSYCPLIPES